MPSTASHLAKILPAALVVAFLLFDAAAPLAVARLPEFLSLLMYAKGVVIAQLWLLAVWAALGPPPGIRRVMIALSLSLLSAGLFEHGLIYIVTFGFTPGIRQVFLAPMEVIVLSLPLLLLRLCRGWRLVYVNGASAADPEQFSLRQLFFATALVAAAISFAQLAFAELATLKFRGPAPDAWLMLLDDCFGCLVFSLAVVIPLTWLCLRVRFARSVAVLSFLAGTINACAIALMYEYWSGGQLDEGLAGLALFDAVPLTFAGTLLLLRRFGGFALECWQPRATGSGWRLRP